MTARVAAIALLSTLWVEPAFAEESVADQAESFGYSLHHRWELTLLRFLDRSGRPDPRGPILQRRPGDTYSEYRLDRSVANFPLSGELAWARDPEGARVWIQSVDEFTLSTRASLEKHVPHRIGYFGFRYDGFETRNWNTHLLRIDFFFDDVLTDGLFVVIRGYPRWEKDDSDLELQVGYRIPDLAEARLRLVALDPFTNASAGLAKARGEPFEFDEQRDLPLMVLAEASSVRLGVLRAEAYAGVMVPQRTEFTDSLEPERAHVRSESATLAGGMVEIAPLEQLRVGVSGLAVDTAFRREHSDAPRRDVRRTEHHSEVQAYVLAEPLRDLVLETFARRTARPQVENGLPIDDVEWLSAARALWTLGRAGGVDVGLYRMDREATDEQIDRTNHRVVTRAMLTFAPSIWVSFGVGWDLDPRGGSVYDGAGMTLTARF